jgi:uncharacterized iron-regulated protein
MAEVGVITGRTVALNATFVIGSLGYTPENAANKSTNIAADAALSIKYSGVKARATTLRLKDWGWFGDNMTRLVFAIWIIFLMYSITFGQVSFSNDQIAIFDGKGNPATIEQVVGAIGQSEAVFLGEQHDDAVGHAVQMEIFQRAVDRYFANRRVALSLEMFERDVQIVVNEYLNGLISEAQFMSSSRPWGNYKTDYRPLVELAKTKRIPVIAANAPRRYVNMVSRNGRDSLDALTKEAKAWLAPLPFGEPSATYAKKFKDLMGPSPEAQMGIDKILASQSLWDATMSHSVYRFLDENKNPLVIHLNGSFHTESRLGTFEHLMRYRNKTRGLVVTIRYEDHFKTFDKSKHLGLGDFVILTDGKQPRSKR